MLAIVPCSAYALTHSHPMISFIWLVIITTHTSQLYITSTLLSEFLRTNASPCMVMVRKV